VLARILSVLVLAFLALTSCAHPNRISRSALRRLTNNGAPFVLVFGSLTTIEGAIPQPTIRFVRQENRTAPVYLLRSLAITNGGRFYAILPKPRAPEYTLTYLDEFYIEVGSAATGFDRIDYVRLRKTDEPQAMYVGEIEMVPAPQRTTQGQALTVRVRDDYANATQELKRLYPRFQGTAGRAVGVASPR
jgi:hypothetical protein